jgi:putative transposase
VTNQRRPIFADSAARNCLREAIQAVQIERLFELEAMVLLSDHLHCLWRLPEDDPDYSVRWACIKKDLQGDGLRRAGIRER